MKRIEDPRLITGTGMYVDDVNLPHMAYGAVIRSPYAHARIASIDASDALNSRGVLLALTGEEVAKLTKPLLTAQGAKDLRSPRVWALPTGKVRYVGEPVAFVVAEDRYAAKDAVELVNVEYEPLEPVTDPEKATSPDAPTIHEELGSNLALRHDMAYGDVESAFKEADLAIHERLVNQRVAAAAMEPRVVAAKYEQVTGLLTVWASTQIPFEVRSVLARVLMLPENRIRVITQDVGGGFGSKLQTYPEEVLTCLASIKLGRPVKWVEERGENLIATTHGRDQVHYVELAARNDGTVLGLKDRIVADFGAYPYGAALPIITARMLQGCYKMRGLAVEVFGVYTNKTPMAPYRGAGRPEATYVIERMMDILARELGMDPAQVRLKNFIEIDKFPYKTLSGLTYDSGNYPAALNRALELVGYYGLREKQSKLRGQGRYVGAGISCYIEMCGIGPAIYENAIVRIDEAGRVTVIAGTTPTGQGHETAYAQIVEKELGIDYRDIVVAHSDTLLMSHGFGTFGSRATPVGGAAVLMAARAVKDKILKLASHILKTRYEYLELANRRVRVRGNPEKSITLEEVANLAYDATRLPAGMEPGLEAMGYFDPEGNTYPFGAHVAIVEVDPETGHVRVLRYVCVDDYGRVINPMLAEGQIHGGAAQGIAQALYEEIAYSPEGQPMASTFIDYLVPTAAEAVDIEADRMETPSPLNPLGVKGVGEAATIGATPAIVNAVEDALTPFKVRLRTMPLKPETIWMPIMGKLRDEPVSVRS